MILDAGVFSALENPAQRGVVLALVERMRSAGIDPITNEAALAQVWRKPATQVPVSMLLKASTVYPLGDPKLIGMRCAASVTSDVVDASLAVLSTHLDVTILTTDPDDMARLNAPHVAL